MYSKNLVFASLYRFLLTGTVFPQSRQISLFEKDTKQEEIDKVMDSIKEKYGYSSITRAKKINIEDKYKVKKVDE